MSLYDSASLVMIPSGYKEDKVYSIKPTDGSGDLTFTRSNDTATRVGPDGLIEKVRTNLLTYSEQFDNAAWSKRNVTITANATTAPDGTLTAEKLVENSANAFHALEGNTFAYSAGEHSWSIFAKASERNVLQLLMNGSLNINCVANFNLTTGVVTLELNCQASIENVGNGWFRCSMVYAAITNSVPIGYYSIQTSPTAARATTYLGDGTSGLFLWGAQMTTGVTTPYIPTTTAAVSVGPVADLPRLDYSGGASCPSLLLEPQRTNLLLNSNDFSAYSKIGTITTTPNYGVSPDGTTNSTRVVFDDSNNALYILSVHSGSTESSSIYIKGISGETIKFGKGVNVAGGGIFTLNGDWQRLTFSSTTGNQFTLSTYGGVTARDVEIYGAQAEVGSYPTSYIPTLGAVSTRAADSASKTGISALIGQTEGTMFLEAKGSLFENSLVFCLHENTTNDNRLVIALRTLSNEIQFVSNVAGNSEVNETFSSASLADNYVKVAYRYAPNDSAFFINGVKVGEDLICNTYSGSTLSRLSFENASGTSPFYGNVKQNILFPTALTDAEAIALTTL